MYIITRNKVYRSGSTMTIKLFSSACVVTTSEECYYFTKEHKMFMVIYATVRPSLIGINYFKLIQFVLIYKQYKLFTSILNYLHQKV